MQLRPLHAGFRLTSAHPLHSHTTTQLTCCCIHTSPLPARCTALVDGCQDKYLNFGLEGGRLITLDRTEAELQGPNILRVHAIPCDRCVQGQGQPEGEVWIAAYLLLRRLGVACLRLSLPRRP